MKIRHLKVNNSRLNEGQYYNFRIIKELDVDPHNPMYIMEDPLGYKVLMPKNYYLHYNLQLNQTIACRVDKINCNGRMYIEPMHPVYSEGNTYEFPIVNKGKRKNIIHEDEFYIEVSDVHNQNWIVRVFSEKLIPNDDRVQCHIDRIKKGILYLRLTYSDLNDGYFKNGDMYEFLVIGEKTDPITRNAYYILEDHNGVRHPLQKKFYHHYAIKSGQKIHCKVDSLTGEGYYFLEPENPWYKTGEHYQFKILELNRLEFSDGNIQEVLILEDPHGEDIKTFIEKDQLQKIKNKLYADCFVKKIRKSRLELEII